MHGEKLLMDKTTICHCTRSKGMQYMLFIFIVSTSHEVLHT